MKSATHASLAIVGLFLVSMAHAGQNEISGFRYQDCNSEFCIEVTAKRAWISQIDWGFTAEEQTVVSIIPKKTSTVASATHTGVSATLHPRLEIVTLDLTNGDSVIFSTKDGSVRVLKLSAASLTGEKP